MGDRLHNTEGLKAGDVVMVAVQLSDKVTGAPFWWKRFAVIYRTPRRVQAWAQMLTLKLHIDMNKDLREVDFEKDVVTRVEEHAMPQGVAAMFMKHVSTGTIKVDGS